MKTETSRDAAPAAAPEASSGFNLSRWALDHRPLTRYLMVVLMLMGGFTYFQLGQDEDPPFTFRAMVVQAWWPGASAQEMAEQVTDKIERLSQEVPYADVIRSYTKPGNYRATVSVKDARGLVSTSVAQAIIEVKAAGSGGGPGTPGGPVITPGAGATDTGRFGGAFGAALLLLLVPALRRRR